MATSTTQSMADPVSDGNNHESDVSTQHIHEITVFIVLFIMSFLFTICLIATVLLTKTVRTQLIGILLINMSIAVLIFQVTGIPVMIRDALHYSYMGQISCHLIYIVTSATSITFNITVLLLGIDVAFNLPGKTIVRITVTISLWTLPFVLAVVEVYCTGTDFIFDVPKMCELIQRYSEAFEVFFELVQVFLPLAAMLVMVVIIVIICCKGDSGDQPFRQSKALPFLASATIILLLVSPLRIVYFLKMNGWNIPVSPSELQHWLTIVHIVFRPVICIIWVFMFHDFRRTIFRNANSDGESVFLLNYK